MAALFLPDAHGRTGTDREGRKEGAATVVCAVGNEKRSGGGCLKSRRLTRMPQRVWARTRTHDCLSANTLPKLKRTHPRKGRKGAADWRWASSFGFLREREREREREIVVKRLVSDSLSLFLLCLNARRRFYLCRPQKQWTAACLPFSLSLSLSSRCHRLCHQIHAADQKRHRVTHLLQPTNSLSE